jgi:lipid-A-disaccharide synthase
LQEAFKTPDAFIMPSVMISCGEASGDLYAGALVAELKRLDPTTSVFGFGGSNLADAGAELIADYGAYSVTGLAEALRVLPRSYALYRRLVGEARERRPSVFVAIDFPDFNFRLGQALKAIGVPVVYYIGPQLWAWRPGRLETMKRFVDLVLPIFPFEERIYRDAGIPVEFVGHPLIDLAHASTDRATLLGELGFEAHHPTVGLLPGSRPNELRAILPDLVEAARLVSRQVPQVQFVLARAPNLADDLLAPAVAARDRGEITLSVVAGRTDDVLAGVDVVVTASGTATVQTALHERPMVIVYRVSPLSYWLGRRFVKVDTFGMANLIAGRRFIPELIQDAFTPEAVAGHTVKLLTDQVAAAEMRRGLRDVRLRLGQRGASRRAAEAVLRVARTARV